MSRNFLSGKDIRNNKTTASSRQLIDFDFLNAPFDSIEQWVKADMIYTVSFDRLNIPFNGKDEEGNRKRIYKILDEKDMKEIRKAVLAGLCINLQQFVDMDGD